jgi:hypothetical protein
MLKTPDRFSSQRPRASGSPFASPFLAIPMACGDICESSRRARAELAARAAESLGTRLGPAGGAISATETPRLRRPISALMLGPVQEDRSLRGDGPVAANKGPSPDFRAIEFRGFANCHKNKYRTRCSFWQENVDSRIKPKGCSLWMIRPGSVLAPSPLPGDLRDL